MAATGQNNQDGGAQGQRHTLESTEQAQHIAALTQRLERLERANRRWHSLVALGLLIGGLGVLLGASKPEAPTVAHEVQAHAFVLLDQAGTPLARLGLLPHGAWGLGFYDQGKKSRIVLSLDGDGTSSLSLLSKEGKGGMLLSASGNGTTSLRFLDSRWKTRATLATWPDGSPFLQFTDREGKDRALLRYTDVTATQNGSIIKHPGPSLMFFNQDEKVLWQTPEVP